MANTFKFGNGNWAVKDGNALAYNDENNNFKPLPFDFTRASSATRVNKQGLIETVGSGKPRIDFLNNTKGHLLLEPSRRNLFTQSETFSNWSNSQSTETINSGISPDGSNTATKVKPTTSSSTWSGLNSPSLSITSGTAYTFSVFAKKDEYSYVQVGGSTPRFNGSFSTIDLSNGTVVYESGINADVESYGNGWYKISFTQTAISTGSGLAGFIAAYNYAPNSRLQAFGGDGSSGILVWGCQFEVGSYATSYIPTEGLSETRVAETCVDAGNDKILGTHCTMFINLSTFTNNFGSAEAIRLSDGTTTTDRIQIFTETTDNTVKFIATANGSDALSGMAATTATTDLTSETKIAVQIGSNANRIYVNGTKIGETSTSFSFNSGELKSLNFATSSSGGNNFYGKIRNVRLYNTALTDTELQNLTS